MAEDITVRSAEGRPVDPEVPGSAADMDVAVAVLLAMHDDRRTDGLPPWPPTWAVYGHMWEERDKATREVDRLRAENATLRDLLAKALPWIDDNDSHDDYLLTVAIREALGEGS